MMKKPPIPNKNKREVDYGNQSDDSDISAYTNDKVFKGVSKKIMKANRSYEVKSKSQQQEPSLIEPNTRAFNIENIKKEENLKKKNKIALMNLKIEDEINENGGSSKMHIHNEENPSQRSQRKVNSPLSFRPKLLEEMNKIVVNKEGILQIQEEEEDSSTDDKPSRKSTQEFAPKNISVKEQSNNQGFSTKGNGKRKSHKDDKMKKHLIPLSPPQCKTDGSVSQLDPSSLIRNILSSSGDELDTNNYETTTNPVEDITNTEKNVFWNLIQVKETPPEDYEKVSSKRSNPNNIFSSHTEPSSNRLNSMNTKFNYKTATSSQISCTISKIEKGIAVLVSNDDHIFTLPVCFLPKNLVQGNSYQISIDETVKAQNKLNSIQQMQIKYMKK